MSKPGRAKLLWAAFVALALLALIGWWWVAQPDTGAGEGEVGAPEEEAVIRESTVEPGQQVLVLAGQWRAQATTAVPAPMTGPVARWHVEPGAIVEQGDLLAELALGELQAQRGQAQARYNVARQQVRTLRQLVAGGYEPAERLTAAEAEFDAAQAAIAEVEQALERTRVYAPAGGTVEVLARSDTLVQAGDALAQIIDRDPLQLTVNIPAEHVKRVEAGAQVRLDVQGTGLLEGRVVSIGKADASGGDSVRAQIEAPNPNHLRPAQGTVEVRIVL